MRIDCDTHYWPIDFLERVDHPGKGRIEREDDTTVSFYRAGELVHRFKHTRWDLAARKAVMDQEGFDAQVLIPDNRPFLYELGHGLGRAMATAYNDYVAEAVKNEPRFIGVSWVYLADMAEAVRELERSATTLGLRAVKLTGGFGDSDLDDHAMWPLYEAAEALDLPILVHPAARAFEDQTGHPWLIGADRYAGMRFLASTLGFPFTYMHTITRLIYSGALDRFPKLRFAFFEGGAGWVPFLQNQLDREAEHRSFRSYLAKNGIKLQRKPSEYFDRLYVAAIANEPYLADTARQWRDHRIIIGSDFDHADPVATWPTTVERLRKIEGLSVQDQDKILGGNAMRLLGLSA
jgi:aminocarboxymuconate-semialdehyde decarboxylase